MALPVCATFTVSSSDYVGASTTGGLAYEVPNSSLPPGPSFIGQLRWEGTTTLPAGFISRIGLASGPGPVFTKEIILAQMGPGTGAAVDVSGSVLVSTVMPNAGRVWDRTIDRIWTEYSGFTQNLTGAQFTLFTQVCSGQTTAQDCCAEILAKLDQLLGNTERVMTNQP